MNIDQLIDAVTAKTKGTKGDPLTREEVEPVVQQTLVVLNEEGLLNLASLVEMASAGDQALEDGGDIEPPAE